MVILPLDADGKQYACWLLEDRFPRDRCARLAPACDRLVVGRVFASLGTDSQSHTDSNHARMQPFRSRLPNWSYLQLLLRNMGLYAALLTVLCASLFRADPGADTYTYRM